MKSVLGTITAVFTAVALIICMTSCGADSGLKVSGSDQHTGFDSGTTICRGVWAADDGDQRIGYYLFTDERSGKFIDAINGTELALTVETEKKTTVFRFDSLEGTRSAEMLISDSGSRRLTWKDEDDNGKSENWSLIVGADPGKFTFYSAEILTGRAQEDFTKEVGQPPEYSSYWIDVNGNVKIDLQLDGEKMISISYEVNSITGKGSNLTSHEAVDFSK